VTLAGASGLRRHHTDNGAVAGWQLVGCVVLVVSTVRLFAAKGNPRTQSRMPKKFRMHLSAAASSPGYEQEVYDFLAPVPQAPAVPCGRSQLQAMMPCTAQPQVIALPSEPSCLFVQGMMQTTRRPALAPRFNAALRNASRRRRAARRARVGTGTTTVERKARRRVGSRLQNGISPVSMRCTRYDPSTLRVQIQVGLRASRRMRTARGREAETPATSKDSCCEGTRSVCLQPKTVGALSTQTINRL